MKVLLFALLTLTLPLSLLAQAIDWDAIDKPRSGMSYQPFKGASVIILATPDSSEVAFDKLLDAIADAGWFVSNEDRRRGTVKTDSRVFNSAGSAAGQVMIRQINDSPAFYRLVATMQGGVIGYQVGGEVKYIGAENAPYKGIFRAMADIAKAYKGEHRVIYAIDKQ